MSEGSGVVTKRAVPKLTWYGWGGGSGKCVPPMGRGFRGPPPKNMVKISIKIVSLKAL